jgi:nitrate/nitrite-specific signal transduction histidine kinase
MTTKKQEEGHEEFVNLFEKGLKFTKEILAENERLRFRLAGLEAEVEVSRRHSGSPTGDAMVEALRRQVSELEAERTRLLSSFQEVESLNKDYQQRYDEIEAEHNNLANLYIASFQLHSTLAFREVVQVVSEIVINLIGVAQFALYLFDARSEKLHPVATEGLDLAALKVVDLNDPIIGKAARTKERFVRDSAAGAGAGAPLAVVPLSTMESLVGAIVIEKLLVQKEGFSPVDHELFNLLGAHAATSLLASLLRESAGGDLEALSVERALALLQ